MAFRILAVVSNKGGAGKSMVSSNLALELRDQGLRVGLLDADVDSPYLAEIIGAKGRIGLDTERRMIPVQHDGLPVMSFALWTPGQFDGASMFGDMHQRWIEDAVGHTAWGPIDLLVIDLPAGLSDEYLALKRLTGDRLIGLVAVAQPNVVSGLRRVYHTAAYHHFRILGVLENMSGAAFGTGHVEAYCAEQGLHYFGSVPLDPRIRQGHEQGEPRLPEDLRSPIRAAAKAVMERLAAVPAGGA